MNKIFLALLFMVVLSPLALSQDRQSRPDSVRSVTRQLGKHTTITTTRINSGRTVSGITRQVGSQRVTTWSDGARTTTRSVGRSRITEFKKK